MKLYRFSPIENKQQLFEAIEYTHFACYQLCQQSFGENLPNAGNVAVFCHYEDEYKTLTGIRDLLTEPADDPKQKYYKLLDPVSIEPKNGVPETKYTHLYIRKPDPYRHHVGDIDFYIDQDGYDRIKQQLETGALIKGARVFPRDDLDMIELYDPNSDVLAYVGTDTMTKKAGIKQT